MFTTIMGAGLVLALTIPSCGPRDECEEAADKLVGECEFSGYVLDNTIGECKDVRKCRAECVNDHSCTEVIESGDASFTKCLSDCTPATP
jgi:hypothetical protein